MSVQNIIGRVTHGLIGMDIYLNEKAVNAYLQDFLTLTEEEIKETFLAMTVQKKLVPSNATRLSNDESAFVECVKKAQGIVSKIERLESDDEIENCIKELGSKLDIIYATLPER